MIIRLVFPDTNKELIDAGRDSERVIIWGQACLSLLATVETVDCFGTCCVGGRGGGVGEVGNIQSTSPEQKCPPAVIWSTVLCTLVGLAAVTTLKYRVLRTYCWPDQRG